MRIVATFFAGIATGISLLVGSACAQPITPVQPVEIDEVFKVIETYTCAEVKESIKRGQQAPQPASAIERNQQLILEIYQLLRRCAFYQASQETLLEGLLRGMVAALEDPHARFYNPEEYKDFQSEFSGSGFQGVGLELDTVNGVGQPTAVAIIAIVPGSPASASALRVGDRIVAVDGKGFATMADLNTVIKSIRGDRGTSVRLRVTRTGLEQPFEVVIVRELVKPVLASATTVGDWIHITLPNHFVGAMVQDNRRGWTNTLCIEVERVYRAEVVKHPDTYGVVLDLRNNTGGSLFASGCVFALLAPTRLGETVLTVSERDRDGVHPQLSVRPVGLLNGRELVVLVNEGSASASEIVAKLIQYYRIGTVVGTLTYGKGSVQTVETLGDGKSGIKYTDGEYLIGARDALAPVQCVGVTPDIVMKPVGKPVNTEVSQRECDGKHSFTGAKDVRDISPRDVKRENPDLYERIIRLMRREPFGLVPAK